MHRFPAMFTALIVLLISASPSFAQARKSARAADPAVAARLTAALDALAQDGDYARARREVGAVFDEVIAHGAPNEPATLREAAFAVRLVGALARAETIDRPAMLAFLRASPNLAGDLLFTLDPEREDPAKALALLERLRAGRDASLEKHASLVAAVCLVHDQPLKRRFNENTVEGPDGAVVLDYFIRNAGRMYYGTSDLPPELMVHVVDVTPGVDELAWSLDRHAGHNDVGGLFRTIRYDYESLLGGREKGATAQGYTLQNIHRFGGVCVDQAYFAVMSGKSIGVPTAYVRARAAQAGHAWVGFLQRSGNGARWNFDTGRYDAYKGLKGEVIDPQTGEQTSDGELTLAAGLITVPRVERQEAAAYADAAARLIAVIRAGTPWPPERAQAAPEEPARRSRTGGPRAATSGHAANAAGALTLIDKSIEICPFHLRTWGLVGQVAKAAGGLDAKQRRHWMDLVQRFCGADYPDFTLSTLRPLIESFEDPREQDRAWTSLLRLFNQRPDLAAEVLTAQGRLWAKAGDAEAALACYRQVLDRYTNDGPFVMEALLLADRLLSAAQREPEALRLYQTSWGRCTKPEISAYYRAGSNWFQIGTMYGARLLAAGQQAEAQRVMDSLQR